MEQLNGTFLFIGNTTRKKRKKLNKKNPFFTVKYLAPIRRCCQTAFSYSLFTITLVLFLFIMRITAVLNFFLKGEQK